MALKQTSNMTLETVAALSDNAAIGLPAIVM
jgi:hypothetical protein